MPSAGLRALGQGIEVKAIDPCITAGKSGLGPEGRQLARRHGLKVIEDAAVLLPGILGKQRE